MRVNLDGTKFDVRFYKEEVGSRRKRTIKTHCVVSSIDDNETGRVRFIECGTGSAKQNKVDRYSKVKGKKIAMARALQGTNLGKKERTIFWDTFEKEFDNCK